MQATDCATLANLAADFPGWHLWRPRDGRGRDGDWNAIRRRPSARATAPDADALRGLLEQWRAVEALQAAGGA